MFELIQVNDLASLAKIIDGNLIGENKQFKYLTTDSRNVSKNSLFLALRGEKYNGHHFCESALEAGAEAYISTDEIINHTGIVVKDTYLALLKMARHQQQQVNPKTLAITGSNGKTTLKEMVAHILIDKKSIKTKDNENNQFGIPFTVLRLKADTKFLVLECGARKMGDFDLISEYLQFDVLTITNINNSHIGIFGNQANIIETKMKLLDGVAADGSFIDGAFEDWSKSAKLMGMSQTFGAKVHRNLQRDSVAKLLTEDWSCEIVSGQEEGNVPGYFGLSCQQALSSGSRHFQFPKKINLGPRHNCHNALMAVLAARELGVKFSESMERICEFDSPLPDRYGIEHIGKHVLINDTYNANPDSFASAINDLATNCSYPKNKLLIMGDMLELGQYSETEHAKILEQALGLDGLKAIFLKGKKFQNLIPSAKQKDHESQFDQVYALQETEDFPVALLSDLLDEESVILVKGSRKMNMEQFVDLLRNNLL